MKKIHISKRVVIAACIIALAALTALTGGVIAKYVKQVKQEHNSTTAKAFYFTSDYLKASDESYTYYLGSTTTSVSFELRNFKDDFNVSEVDTNYTVTIEPTNADTDFTVTVDGAAAANKNEFTLTAGKETQTTHEITLNNLKSGNTYKVTVAANGGYTKALMAVFAIDEAKSGFYYNIADKGEYLLLTVWTENFNKGTVKIDVPANLIPDVTDDLMKDIKNRSGETYTAFTVTDTTSFAGSNNASRSYRFFKDPGYTTGTFTVKMGDATATESSIP